MRTETEIKQKGIAVLLKELGEVDTEIFIKTLIREPFDYTTWQQELWSEVSVEALSEKAMEYQQKKS